MNCFKELDLHEKLYHSRYLSKECPKCMMRFLEDKQLKHHLQYTCSRFCPKIESSSTSGSSSLSRKTRRSLTEYQNQNSWFFICIIEINKWTQFPPSINYFTSWNWNAWKIFKMQLERWSWNSIFWVWITVRIWHCDLIFYIINLFLLLLIVLAF